VRAEVTSLHRQLGAAGYFAVHRGSQIVVVFTDDCPEHPRLRPIAFGFHEAPHAHALGKIPLALDARLEEVADRGIAWEYGEFRAGSTCAAAAVLA
jgi:IclR family transcriptional regulator, acetate operon repressor